MGRNPRQSRRKGLTLPQTSNLVCDRKWERSKVQESLTIRGLKMGAGQVLYLLLLPVSRLRFVPDRWCFASFRVFNDRTKNLHPEVSRVPARGKVGFFSVAADRQRRSAERSPCSRTAGVLRISRA